MRCDVCHRIMKYAIKRTDSTEIWFCRGCQVEYEMQTETFSLGLMPPTVAAETPSEPAPTP